MKKVVRDGMVAVLVSPGFGAGHCSWNGDASPFEPELVNAIENGATDDEKEEIANRLYPEEYNGGARDLVVRWVPEGSAFRIKEYDGSESIEVRDNVDWYIACPPPNP